MRILFVFACSMLCTLNRMCRGRFIALARKCQQVICMAIVRSHVRVGSYMLIRETFFCLKSFEIRIEIRYVKIRVLFACNVKK